MSPGPNRPGTCTISSSLSTMARYTIWRAWAGPPAVGLVLLFLASPPRAVAPAEALAARRRALPFMALRPTDGVGDTPVWLAGTDGLAAGTPVPAAGTDGLAAGTCVSPLDTAAEG